MAESIQLRLDFLKPIVTQEAVTIKGQDPFHISQRFRMRQRGISSSILWV
jgi:hypothetical protein